MILKDLYDLLITVLILQLNEVIVTSLVGKSVNAHVDQRNRRSGGETDNGSPEVRLSGRVCPVVLVVSSVSPTQHHVSVVIISCSTIVGTNSLTMTLAACGNV